ncbi:hypothetical protein BN7_6665 [Wickerhamomyces ciferrii]|uniref:Uncharacterized protein n=1 Tax=Wickerhamomyces ciferrii (strain ATCC 14091 / BCRC 22168 / CBS 111 / JCM 3599 / NBRC 0793 / NRRL Y-1031 F-60-10) TaxID=1206466 RepID=K0KUZ0_WICCF|nr:uncharacterized protein BN7_6665 [Wickerhamomyces ciferrii]CCH47056.1 hypothetical protein BN7_6665 [Wickerhamomyces ciferrii]
MTPNPDDIFTIDTKLKFMFWTMSTALLSIFSECAEDGNDEKTMYYKSSSISITGYMKIAGRASVVQISDNLFLFSGSNWLERDKNGGRAALNRSQMSIVTNYNEFFEDIKDYPFDRNWIASICEYCGDGIDDNIEAIKRENPLLNDEDIEYGKVINEKTEIYHAHQVREIMGGQFLAWLAISQDTHWWRFHLPFYFDDKVKEQFTKTLRSYLEAKQIEELGEESDVVDDDDLLLRFPVTGSSHSLINNGDQFSNTEKNGLPRSRIEYPEISTGGQTSVWFGLGRNTSPFLYNTLQYS